MLPTDYDYYDLELDSVGIMMMNTSPIIFTGTGADLMEYFQLVEEAQLIQLFLHRN